MNDELIEYYRERGVQTAHLAEEAMEQEVQLNEEEEEIDPARVCWSNLNGNDERCQVITGFNCDQFVELFEACEDAIPVTIGRGRRSRVPKHDRLLLVLCYVKHYETYAKLGETFLLSKAQTYRNVDETIKAITPVLYERYVERIYDLIGCLLLRF